MSRPSPGTVATAAIGGIANVAVVLALYVRADYPTLESTVGTGTLAATAFFLGFVALLVTAHTRLLTPAIGFLTVLAATVYLEHTSPVPEWSELNGHVIVDGPTHVASYANTWYVWIALFLFAGVVEFGLRDGYGLLDHRLRNLPVLPLSRFVAAWVSFGFATLVGVATMVLVIRSGITPRFAALGVFVVAAVVAAVPLVALLMQGIVSPVVLFAIIVPYFLGIEVFTTTDSPVHILLFGPYAIVLAVVWVIEASIRSRFFGWDGGRFSRRVSK